MWTKVNVLVDDPEQQERITQEYYEKVVEVQIDQIDDSAGAQ
jgi:hypothetical protein